MTEKHDETCEDCGHGKYQHELIGKRKERNNKFGRCKRFISFSEEPCSCKKFKAKTSLDKKSKGCSHAWWDARKDCNFCNPKAKNHSPEYKWTDWNCQGCRIYKMLKKRKSDGKLLCKRCSKNKSLTMELNPLTRRKEGTSNLSEKMKEVKNSPGVQERYGKVAVINICNHIENLQKEFIRKLKECFRHTKSRDTFYPKWQIFEYIDEIFGEDLI